MANKTTKIALRAAAYFLYLLSSVFFIIYIIYYRPYSERLLNLFPAKENLMIPANIATSTINQLSYVHTGKKSSFTNFPIPKPEGIIRIGALGDSYTYGAEVDEVSDFPGILQKIFIKNGYKNVEVLNMGSSGYSGHQSIRLWELEGKKYNLDFILLGPKGMQAERDLSFAWALNQFVFSSINGRYILKNNTLEFVEPIGGLNKFKRLKLYNNFFPHLDYLFYDINPPAALRGMLPKDKEIKNPFYYKKDPSKEYQEIYKLLFNKIASNTKQVIYLQTYKHRTDNIAKPDDLSNFYFDYAKNPLPNIFRATNYHAGPLMNNYFAQQFFNILTNNKSQELSFINLRNYDFSSKATNIPNKTSINELNKITINLDDIPLAFFVSDKREKYEDGELETNTDFFSKNNIQSLITLNPIDKQIFNSLFLPLDFILKKDSTLYIKYEINKKDIFEEIGKPTFISENIAFFDTAVIGAKIGDFSYRAGRIAFNKNAKHLDIEKNNDFSIYLDDKEIYTSEHENNNEFVFLKPVKYNHYIFRSLPKTLNSMEDYSDDGVIFMRFFRNNSMLGEVAIGNWKKETTKKEINQDEIEYFIKKDNNVGIIEKN